ncbi:zinc finger-containing ubiquitin peptidase 1 isoform X2 [Desmodus rotundus]|uniref:zinc finger-containing ubiquitin peptidase 1 isoform X2 n=1 Tax=Desmodus rotundus TaxID=9430 RepID=UPI002380F2DB|nr:zinc finger-containing ubiquitin peptidase 1 isoform X2 [Desmodus rotundus]
MLSCDICGETVTSELDMKSHLLIVHMENEVMCPFCKLSGVSYDEVCFHIETAHFEQNELQRNFEKTNKIQYVTSDNRKDNTQQCRMDVNSSMPSACASNSKISARSLPEDSTLKPKTFYSENLTESRQLKSKEKQCDLSQIKGSIYDTMYSPPECPFCGKTEACTQDMETHVKTKHANFLDSAVEACDQPVYDCPMCGLICTNYHILQEHVDLHLEESNFRQGMERVQCSRDLELAHQLQQEEDQKRRSEESIQEREEFQKLQRQYGLDSSGGYKQQQLQRMEREVNGGRMPPSEFHRRKAEMMESLAAGIDDGRTRTSGITEALYRYYQCAAPDVRRVWLSAVVDHFHSSCGDKGWGCGYRNFQMLLSSLLQNDAYDDCLKGMSIPCIPKIQSMIEDAWREGFDPQGASQLNNKLQGTKAWIGACEIYTLLTSLRVKCRIVDFHKSTGPLGTHPRLFEWILNYYSSEREGVPKVVCTSKPPIYLQHQDMQKLLKQDVEANNLKQLRKFVGNLKHKQYQIVAVEGVLTAEEKIARRQASQVFTAEKIP